MIEFIESKTWQGGIETGDEIEWLGPSLGVSPRKERTERKKPKSPSMGSAGRKCGTVMRWYSERGFGFIQPDSGGSDIFVHVSELRRSGIDRLTWGERVSYEIINGKNGKPAAANIEELHN
ncbi:cold-shock protein [Paenibacillus elgii]|uniref:cold-shock protein n=1 Tax=Paenibacillus elgii TaxID=189691 RepID=UPI0020421432|nr:cold-shock protein [Paenibacillus elgii]MCM3272960.1 cold-shock protein [Paenibacillus elgii]